MSNLKSDGVTLTNTYSVVVPAGPNTNFIELVNTGGTEVMVALGGDAPTDDSNSFPIKANQAWHSLVASEGIIYAKGPGTLIVNTTLS